MYEFVIISGFVCCDYDVLLCDDVVVYNEVEYLNVVCIMF